MPISTRSGQSASMSLFGNAIAANMFLLGLAFQKGGLPLSAAALERAIGLNGQATEMNIAAFRWGRRAAHDPQSVRDRMNAARQTSNAKRISKTPEEAFERRRDFLKAYQSKSYAARYVAGIARIRRAEEAVAGKAGAVTDAAMRGLFKLMAIKDEYEVARLYSDGSFHAQLAGQFESWDRLEFHLAPPVLSKPDHGTGKRAVVTFPI